MTDSMKALVLLFTLIGGVVGFEYHYAKDTDLQELAMDFKQERLYNRMDRVEERMWVIKSRYVGVNPQTLEPEDVPILQWSECDRKEYMKLDRELRRVQKEFGQ